MVLIMREVMNRRPFKAVDRQDQSMVVISQLDAMLFNEILTMRFVCQCKTAVLYPGLSL